MSSMSSIARIEARYRREPAPIRMGHLASNLLRLSDWVRMPKGAQDVLDLLNEIAWMLEANPEFASEELADMQREICHWRRIWPVEAARSLLAFRARRMSDRILELSGLLKSRSPNAGTDE